jgi:SAM-dependent methyltransferase
MRALWDARAKENWRTAIYDTAETRNPATSATAFDAAGTKDARLVAWFVDPSMRVVDLGCGVGRVLKPLSGLCREVVGIDWSMTMLKEAREYLRDVPNAALLHTEGESLHGVDSDSVDFLYSLLCLIHVDRRSAYRYMLEIQRVLRPGGLAFLQFHNILTPQGLDKFRRVLEAEYPLEFYTESELRWLLASVGLDTVCVHAIEEYLFITVRRGSAADWIEATARGIIIDELELDGAFAGEPARIGAISARVRSTLDEPRTLAATLTVTREAATPERRIWSDALLVVEGGTERSVRFELSDDGLVEIRVDGDPALLARKHTRGPLQDEPGMVHVGLLPSGFHWNPDTVALFPGLLFSQTLASPQPR